MSTYGMAELSERDALIASTPQVYTEAINADRMGTSEQSTIELLGAIKTAQQGTKRRNLLLGAAVLVVAGAWFLGNRKRR